MNQERDKFLTEAIGECWHEWVKKDSMLETRNIIGGIEYGGYGYECSCGFRLVNRVNWHIGEPANLHPVSCKNNDFSTWSGFGKLWAWTRDQGWWKTNTLINPYKKGFVESQENIHYSWTIRQDLINPDRFANAVYEFLQED